MTTPQPGDRVRVEYEAEYESGGTDGHCVSYDAPDSGQWFAHVPHHATVTVLPKPLRVGDMVRLGEDPEPPEGTTLLLDRTGESLRRFGQGWTYASSSHDFYQWRRCGGRSDEWTVVWLPEVES